MKTSSIRKSIVDRRTKGIPGTTAPFALEKIGSQGWNVLSEDMPQPLMVLKQSNLNYNIELFGDYLQKNNLSLAPHGKTTMSPQIFEQQLQYGAWGITAATIDQLLVMRDYGVERIILANQLVGKSNICTVAHEINGDPDFEFFCFVDSSEQLDNIAEKLANLKLLRPINLLIEVGAVGGRTGVRNKSQALDLVHKILEMPDLFKFTGIAAFEGAIPGLGKSAHPITEYSDLVLEIARQIPEHAYAELDEFILTGGGSAYFDIVIDRFKTLNLSVPVRIVLRSGCYVTNDHGAYFSAQEQARLDPNRHWTQKFRPALEIWSYVQSLPEPGLAFLTMGKRDIPFDAGLPTPFRRYRPNVGFLDVGECEVFSTNDQHAMSNMMTKMTGASAI